MENNELVVGESKSLRQMREERRLTRPQVRDAIGVSERMQADWENGKSIPDSANMLALARFYGVGLKKIYEACGLDVSGIPD